eukprot:TRINITY_DN216_c0_g2_i2.p2 TRINITY_DN216_c0_g2~~TRINITY_DN216_c0_g2_i2.p2  ORF type:complete len:210 (+),score=13.87 TRINITY_DN216_c0_g2_i2:26-655(+)
MDGGEQKQGGVGQWSIRYKDKKKYRNFWTLIIEVIMSRQSGQIVCRGCNITLRYPAGASSVRCSQCGTITQARPAYIPQTVTQMSELVCTGCNTRLRYPRNALSVQCALCSQVNNPGGTAQVQCSGCQRMLRYQRGAQSVRCAACSAITHAQSRQGGGGASSSQNANNNDDGFTALGGQFDTMVVVQNPPAVDEDGNEINSIVVGMKLD